MPGSTKALNAAFVASARGDWVAAAELLRALVEEEDDANYAVRRVIIMPMPCWADSVCFFVRPLITWPLLFLARAS